LLGFIETANRGLQNAEEMESVAIVGVLLDQALVQICRLIEPALLV
jgi:hypothetical protein